MIETFIICVGLCIGSFLNVVIYRLPLMLQSKWQQECQIYLNLNRQTSNSALFNLFLPASHCVHCKTPLHFLANIPLLSYILQRGNSLCCQQKIASRYPLVEGLGGIIALVLFFQYGLTLTLLESLLFSYALVALIFIDLDYYLLPDEITLSLLWLGLLINLQGTFATIESAILGAIAAYLFLWVTNRIFYFFTKKSGMGHGDFKLAAALGAWFGYSFLLFILFFASVIGLVVTLALIFRGRQQRHQPVPFGPYLAAAGFMVLTCSQVIRQYFPVFS